MTALAETVAGGGQVGSPQSHPRSLQANQGGPGNTVTKAPGSGWGWFTGVREQKLLPCPTGPSPSHRSPTGLLLPARAGTATSLTQPDCFHEVRHQKTVHDKPRRVLSEQREKQTTSEFCELYLYVKSPAHSFSPWIITHIYQAIHFQCFKAPRQPRVYATWQFNQLLQ